MTGNPAMCGKRHVFMPDGKYNKYCMECGHAKGDDCHIKEGGTIAMLNVGDKVRVVMGHNYGHEGQTGEVTSRRAIEEHEYWVKFADGEDYRYPVGDLELVSPTYHGHPMFYELVQQMTELHSTKNKDYAQGGDPLGNFKRVSVIKKLYPGFPWDSPAGTAIDYMLKQVDCALWMMSQGYEGETESFEHRMFDVSVYSLLAIINKREEKNVQEG